MEAAVLVGEATSIALSIRATLHGPVTLELAGALDAGTAEAAFGSAVHATLRGWTTRARGRPGGPPQAARSRRSSSRKAAASPSSPTPSRTPKAAHGTPPWPSTSPGA